MAQTQRAVSLHRMIADFWRTFGDAFGGYRPERHYMRGPGPKWREKHGIREQETPPWQLPSVAAAEFVLVPNRRELR
jgi:hypothetical protein